MEKTVLICRHQLNGLNQMWAAHHIYNALQEYDHIDAYLFTLNGKIQGLLNEDNVYTGYSTNPIKAFWKYIILLFKLKPDIVHFTNSKWSFFFLLLTKVFSYKTSVMLDVRTFSMNAKRDKLLKLYAGFFDHVFCLNDAIKDYIKVKQSSVLTVGYDSSYFYYDSKEDDLRPCFIFYGSMTKERRIDILLNAIVKVLEEGSDGQFIFAGPMLDSSLKSNNYFLHEQITYLGSLSLGDLSSLVRDVDYGLAYVPNTGIFKKNLPLKSIEMLACGLPIVAVRTLGHEELMDNALGIEWCDWDVDSIAASIHSIVTKHFSRDMISRSVKNYSWKALVKDYVIPFYHSA